MITWNNFDWFALLSIALWGSGAVFALFSKERNRWAILLTLMGTLVFAVFIAGFWIYLQRPPLRTMGETRLWYSFFYGNIRSVDLYPLEVSLDSVFFYCGRSSVCTYQYSETGDS